MSAPAAAQPIDWARLSERVLSDVQPAAQQKHITLARNLLVDAGAVLPLTGDDTLIGLSILLAKGRTLFVAPPPAGDPAWAAANQGLGQGLLDGAHQPDGAHPVPGGKACAGGRPERDVLWQL
jgi:hypothetical protein